MPDASAMPVPGYIRPTKDHSLQTETVLLVDDDEDILGLAAEILETLGYDVIMASTGLEALAILRENPRISILFTDIQMPGMGGEELAGIAAGLWPNLRVIFASGSTPPLAHAIFIQKPYRTADLLSVLRPLS